MPTRIDIKPPRLQNNNRAQRRDGEERDRDFEKRVQMELKDQQAHDQASLSNMSLLHTLLQLSPTTLAALGYLAQISFPPFHPGTACAYLLYILAFFVLTIVWGGWDPLKTLDAGVQVARQRNDNGLEQGKRVECGIEDQLVRMPKASRKSVFT
ncbi:hypothetical protein K458DRAFT_425621 [Lentithecium fluviatile CBS 122367]|uniref:Uncharacterized protein n=1 Tax=Lentithecium fluviatile CBS 122367 TaxID=1168545 RepID=A0A6G1JMB6_9PLEO|nr:hypothetical protein K458DRAFT_425621 [Lentithecium fluviatile CBS 122367]